jgi:hypothetical protein
MDIPVNREHDRTQLWGLPQEGLLERCMPQKEWIMSRFLMLMIGGWASTFAMVGFYALSESGKLLEIRKHIASWLETDHTPEESTQPAGDSLA